ncbi:MAG: tetratricopeptide repeat protein [Ignavibacteria bacterium]|nr:tetratricopeptide repeat protein [Ignavibacteria bacterium]
MKSKFFLLIIFSVLAILSQSFQCESPEMTTAKLAIRHKDYDKAETNLEKEILNNPNNAEAYIYLAEVKMLKHDYPGAAKTINNADPVIKDIRLRVQSEQFKGTLWRMAYNSGIDLFNRYFAKRDEKLLDSAIKVFLAGSNVRPRVTDFYPLIGQAYEVKGDTQNAMKYYNLYIEKIQGELNFAKETGIYLKMSRDDFINKFSKPLSSRGIRFSSASDSLLIDKFMWKGKEVYVYSSDKTKIFTIFGWKVDPPKHWPSDEKEQPTEINPSPVLALAQGSFEQRNYDKTAEYLKIALLLEPDNSNVNAFLVNIYQLQNKQDEAINYAKSLIEKDPQNKLYRAIYGDVLLQLGKFDESIAEYQKALEIDSGYDVVLRNIAAAYKNKVALIQKRQIETNQINEKEYRPDLEKSALYFEKAKNTPRFALDFEILKELAEIYFALNKPEELKKTVVELEGLAQVVKEEDMETYLLALLKVYSSYIKDPNKTKDIQERLEKIKK